MRILEIKVNCCGECPYYNWKKHKCGNGAKNEGEARDNFYIDCPIPWREEKESDEKV